MSEFLEKAGAFLGAVLTDNLLPSLIILVIGILAIRLLMKLVTIALEKSRLDKAAHNLIKSLLRAVLFVLLGLIIAEKLGFDTTGIVALASVLTLAVSLSVQNALTNVIGGFTLLSTKPFKTGDFVEVAGQSGSVQSIGLTYTKLATADNKIVSIPNSAVVSAEIVNYTVSGSRRVDISVSASYDAALDSVLDALREAAQVDTLLPGKEPFAAVKNYGDSAIEYILQVWTDTDNYWNTLFTVNKRIKEIFDAKGIEMTYPHLNVHLDKDPE
jgi:small conductance mechanosensitive channel